jgi:hypothetical protein
MKKIDNVTVENLDVALRICNIEIDKAVLDKVIDLVELIEDKGADVSLRDICELQAEWGVIKVRKKIVRKVDEYDEKYKNHAC